MCVRVFLCSAHGGLCEPQEWASCPPYHVRLQTSGTKVQFHCPVTEPQRNCFQTLASGCFQLHPEDTDTGTLFTHLMITHTASCRRPAHSHSCLQPRTCSHTPSAPKLCAHRASPHLRTQTATLASLPQRVTITQSLQIPRCFRATHRCAGRYVSHTFSRMPPQRQLQLSTHSLPHRW